MKVGMETSNLDYKVGFPHLFFYVLGCLISFCQVSIHYLTQSHKGFLHHVCI
jgi:hypothetical protein